MPGQGRVDGGVHAGYRCPVPAGVPVRPDGQAGQQRRAEAVPQAIEDGQKCRSAPLTA
jgi:hypothetical protein